MASCARVRRRPAARATLAAVALALSCGLLGGATAATAAPLGSSVPVRLVHVTPALTRSGEPLSVVVTRSGPALAGGATVQVTLYSRLTTRSGLLAAIGTTGPVQPVATTGALEASCLTAGASVAVAVPVAPDGATVAPRTLCGRRAPVLRLGCTTGCDGVYPLRVTVRAPGQHPATLDTLVTYAATAPAEPLRVAWVVRVEGTTGALVGATGALAGLAASPTVPATLAVQGQALADAPTGAGVDALLRDVASHRIDELMAEPYVAADLGALRASGLDGEVAAQYALTSSWLRALGIPTPPSAQDSFAAGPQTPTSADAMARAGLRHVIVPATALAQDPSTTLHWGEAFRLGGSPAGPTALASDTELSALTDDTAEDPGLTAADFLGELSFLHYEEPDLPQPRAVVVVTDASPLVATSFVTASLAGIHADPVLTPVTVAEAFRQVPVGANGFLGVRPLALAASQPYPSATVGYLRHDRATIDALASAVRPNAFVASSPIPSLDGQLLDAEQPMSSPEQLAIAKAVDVRLADQLGYFRIYDGPITLTQSGAQLPFTIYSSAPYSFAGLLQLTSPKLTFPQGATLPLPGPVGAFATLRVPATAEVTGDIPLTATLLSPQGHLVMARAVITVRATQTSVVGIALTILAVVVLALWWFRTSRRRAATRR